MKVLIVHNKYQSNNIGGEDIVYRNELQLLQSKLGKENVFFYEVSNDDINKFKLIFNIWFNKQYYKDIEKIIKDKNIDLLHVHNFFPLLTPSIFKAGKNAGAKVVHTLHNYRLWCISGIFFRDDYGICELCTKRRYSFFGIINKCYRKSLIQSILAQFSFWYYRFIKIFDNVDYFFVLTPFQKQKVVSLGIKEQKVIIKPNSININLKLSNNKKDYIYVGRLENSKGIVELLEVWNKLDDKFVLTVIGSGHLDKILRQKYNKTNIIFKGRCSREKTLALISKAKYLIQPSVWYETFGLTIIEALSSGTPVIGFDIGTRKDFIEDGVNGFLCNKNNLKETIEKSFGYDDYDNLSKNALKKAGEFENNHIIEKQISIYNQILKEN